VAQVSNLLLAALLLAFFIEFRTAPWEIAYRHQAVLLFRAELEALAPLATNRAIGYSVDETDRTLVVGDYTREHECCADVMAHYRQAAPAIGWIYAGRNQVGNETTDSCLGVFHGYHAALDVDCVSTDLTYSLHAPLPFPYGFALIGWLSGARWE
jgi:hypothetical protein